MGLSLKRVQAINELAELFCHFLPNKPHPYADQSVSFKGIAIDLGLTQFYPGSSKLPSITSLLLGTLKARPNRFCDLVLVTVQRGLGYRNTKGNPICREEIETVNEIVTKIDLKIPELWDREFLDALPRKEPPQPGPSAVSMATLEALRGELVGLSNLGAHERGPAFERFLNSMFRALKLSPRSSFRLKGEQIDGSFDLEGQTYLVEAKYQAQPVGPGSLREFRDKVEGKATWSRGLFISWSGFSPDAPVAFSRGKRTNIIGMTGLDLSLILQGESTLRKVIRAKARRAAETGEFYVSLQELMLR